MTKRRPDYSIVIPTLDRPQNMRRMLAMFPTAIVTVNQSNVWMFRDVVPKKQLLPHPDMRLIETRNWILDTMQTDAVLQFNDDTRSLVNLVAPQRTFRDPAVIRAICENALQVARDLDIGVFTWNLTRNNTLCQPQLRPFRAAAPVSAHAFGVRGPARDRRFSTDFRGCADVDYTLETLLHDRQILVDTRWHFDCGRMSSGRGGQTGELSRKEFESGQEKVRAKWGRYVGESSQKGLTKKNTWRSFSVKVQRIHPLAQS